MNVGGTPNAINTVGELIAALQRHDVNTPVRWAHQPDYPMASMIEQVVCTPGEPVVWLGEGPQVGYLPEIATTALGWSDRWS
jgi:hypothetical protein